MVDDCTNEVLEGLENVCNIILGKTNDSMSIAPQNEIVTSSSLEAVTETVTEIPSTQEEILPLLETEASL